MQIQIKVRPVVLFSALLTHAGSARASERLTDGCVVCVCVLIADAHWPQGAGLSLSLWEKLCVV